MSPLVISLATTLSFTMENNRRLYALNADTNTQLFKTVTSTTKSTHPPAISFERIVFIHAPRAREAI